MSYFKAKMHKIYSISAGAPPQTPLGELTALSRPHSWIFRAPTSKGRGGERRTPKRPVFWLCVVGNAIQKPKFRDAATSNKHAIRRYIYLIQATRAIKTA